MPRHQERLYAIREVSELTGVPPHLLRQWEEKIPQLNPKRNRANRRSYTVADIDIVRRVKYFTRHEGLTLEGARIRLAQELHGEGRPRSNREALDLADAIQSEVRALIDLLDSA